MAESVDALVSNTNVSNDVPVRPRLRVPKEDSIFRVLFFVGRWCDLKAGPKFASGQYGGRKLFRRKNSNLMAHTLFTFLMLFIMGQTDTTTTTQRFTVQPLPYEADAFAPAISRETIDYHYGKHYKGYVEKLNELIEKTPFATMSLEEIVCDSEGPIYNNAAQVWNHQFYFDTFSPRAQHAPTGPLLKAIDRWFGSFDAMKAALAKACVGLFGSGWVWLVEEESGRLSILSETNAGNPLRYGMKPLLGIDVWEHAYYIDYRNARAKAVEALWPMIDWQVVEQRYEQR